MDASLIRADVEATTDAVGRGDRPAQDDRAGAGSLPKARGIAPSSQIRNPAGSGGLHMDRRTGAITDPVAEKRISSPHLAGVEHGLRK